MDAIMASFCVHVKSIMYVGSLLALSVSLVCVVRALVSPQFMHTPFPSSDVFRVLPTRVNILSSMMAVDLLALSDEAAALGRLECALHVEPMCTGSLVCVDGCVC